MSNNKKKYDCWFCECGRIQILDSEMFNWLEEKYEKRYIVQVCTHCGKTRQMWLTEYLDEGFAINSFSVNPNGSRTEIDTSKDDNEYRFIFDNGIMVPMMHGKYADLHLGNTYVDAEYIIKELDTTSIDEALKKDPLCCTVNTERLIREVKDPDILKSISGYMVGISWKGTEYEHKWE